MHWELHLVERNWDKPSELFRKFSSVIFIYIDYNLIDLSVLIIVNIFVRISKTNRRRRQNGERYSREGKSAAKYRLKDCQYSSRPFLHHLPFCRRKRNFLEKERENEEGIRGKSEFFVFSFPSCHSSLYLSIVLHLLAHFPYSVVLLLLSRLIIRPSSRIITRRLQIIKEPGSDFFSKSDRHLAFRLHGPRSKSSLKPAGEIERRVTNRIEIVMRLRERSYKRRRLIENCPSCIKYWLNEISS